jgi:hypothetical protein
MAGSGQKKRLALDTNLLLDLDIDDDALLLAFNEADLSPARPVHPKRLLKAIG